MSEQIVEGFVVVMEYAVSQGAVPMNQHEGCWESDVDSNWWIAINGHDKTKKCSHGVSIDPFHCYVEWRGLPFGMISPAGSVMADGELENAFIEALEEASEAAAV